MCDSIENICLIKPKLDDLYFRQELLADEETMSYNRAWGGTIPFPKEKWREWYDFWLINNGTDRFYRYLQKCDTLEFVGEIAYHRNPSNQFTANVIVLSKFRGNGYGRIGLELLCRAAKRNGIGTLYDDIPIDNSAIKMFINSGFAEEYRTDEIIMLKKKL